MTYLQERLAAERAANPRVVILARGEQEARAYAERWRIAQDRVLFPHTLDALKGVDKDTANVVIMASWSAHPEARALQGWVQSLINAAAARARRERWLAAHRSSPIN